MVFYVNYSQWPGPGQHGVRTSDRFAIICPAEIWNLGEMQICGDSARKRDCPRIHGRHILENSSTRTEMVDKKKRLTLLRNDGNQCKMPNMEPKWNNNKQKIESIFFFKLNAFVGLDYVCRTRTASVRTMKNCIKLFIFIRVQPCISLRQSLTIVPGRSAFFPSWQKQKNLHRKGIEQDKTPTANRLKSHLV